MAIRGLKEARANTQRVFRKTIPELAHKTVVEVLIMGRVFTLELIPMDTGTLANSAYISHGANRAGAWGQLGFTAAYAAEVHESSGILKGQPRTTGRGNYWDPDAEPEFLAKGFDRNNTEFDKIVARGMKL